MSEKEIFESVIYNPNHHFDYVLYYLKECESFREKKISNHLK
jgi:hypothetical protein